jgi:hypothetical protein
MLNGPARVFHTSEGWNVSLMYHEEESMVTLLVTPGVSRLDMGR